MGNLFRLTDYKPSAWKEIFVRDDGHTEMHVYIDERTGELEIFQMADGEGTRTCLPVDVALALVDGLKESLAKFSKK